MAFGTGLHPTTRNCAAGPGRRHPPRRPRAGRRQPAPASSRWPRSSWARPPCSRWTSAPSPSRRHARTPPPTAWPIASRPASPRSRARPASRSSPLPADIPILGAAIGTFDVVLANIIARVIAQLAPALLRATRPGGTLIASGIIAERRHEAEEPLRAAGLTDVRALIEGDWVTLAGTRQE